MGNYMNRIHPEEAAQAYADAVKKAKLLREEAKVTRIIAETLDNAYITKRIIDKLTATLPAEMNRRIYLYKPSYGNRKYVTVYTALTGNAHNAAYNISLQEGEDNRVDAEAMKAHAKVLDEQADRHESGLTELNNIIGQYNTIVKAYAQMRDTLTQYFGYDKFPYAFDR